MTSLSLTSGVSLLGLWSAIAGTLIRQFCKAPHALPQHFCTDLCCADLMQPHAALTQIRGLAGHLVLSARLQGRLLLWEMSAISKRCRPSGKSQVGVLFPGVTFPKAFAAVLPAWAPTPACSLEQPRLMLFLAAYTDFWRTCRVRAIPGTLCPKACLHTASTPSTWKLPWPPLQLNA